MSRIDLKIKRDNLVKTKGRELWDLLIPEIEKAAAKLNEHFGSGLKITLGPNIIQITQIPNLNQNRSISIHWELRFDPNLMIVEISGQNKGNFPIKGSPDADRIGFVEPGKFYDQQQFAETLLAEKFLRIDLNS
jgi:hypothetical protein